jgi:hypothetical protein
MRLPRPRFTIMGLMILVVIASLVLTGIVRRIERNRERNRRAPALQVARATYEDATLTREVAEIALAEFNKGDYEVHLLRHADDEIALARADLELSLNLGGSYGRAAERANERLQLARQMKSLIGTNARNMTVQSLKSKLAKAQADQQAAKAAFDQLTAAVANAWW